MTTARKINQNDILTPKIQRAWLEHGIKVVESRPKGRRVFRQEQESHVLGFAAEKMVQSLFPTAVETNMQTDGDDVYRYDIKLFGCKIEIKNKKCNVPVQVTHEGSLYQYNADQQDADFYVFTRIQNTAPRGEAPAYSQGFVVGFIPRKEFHEKKYRVQAGEVGSNGAQMQGDTWNVNYKDLYPMQYLADFCKLLAAEREKVKATAMKAN